MDSEQVFYLCLKCTEGQTYGLGGRIVNRYCTRHYAAEPTYTMITTHGKEMNHRLTIELTSDEFKFLSEKAMKNGFPPMPVHYLKFLALSPMPMNFTANDFKEKSE